MIYPIIFTNAAAANNAAQLITMSSQNDILMTKQCVGIICFSILLFVAWLSSFLYFFSNERNILAGAIFSAPFLIGILYSLT